MSFFGRQTERICLKKSPQKTKPPAVLHRERKSFNVCLVRFFEELINEAHLVVQTGLYRPQLQSPAIQQT